MYSNNHYNKKLKDFSRTLRTETVSRAEKLIWKALLRKKQMGVAFKRQRPIGYYIVDFFSAEIGLIIEIDGSSHYQKGEYDKKRQDYLESLGYKIIRFQEGEVIYMLGDVFNKLSHAIWCLKEGKEE